MTDKKVDKLAIVKGALVSPEAYTANAAKVRKAAKLAKAKKQQFSPCSEGF